MAETTVRSSTRAGNSLGALLNGAAWCIVALLVLVVTAELAFFAIHAAHMLNYPYPLDYGEGPLLAQVDQLRAGMPIWRLYGDPGAPPYAVVNYPPMYHLLAALTAAVVGNTLLAGRLVSLVATLAAIAALWQLTDRPTTNDQRPTTDKESTNSERHATRDTRHATRNTLVRALIIVAFMGLPIVREWAVVMRVDMLGLALGLWGLVLVRRGVGRRAVLWAALPLTLSLFVKPSLIAAPAAGLLWLLFRDWRRALLLGAAIMAGGGLAFAILQLASGGWFTLHILTANNNAWQFELARDFWKDQLTILWPLLIPAVLAAVAVFSGRPTTNDQRPTTNAPFNMAQARPQPTTNDDQNATSITHHASRITHHASGDMLLLPLYYTLFGAITAFGIGKVGAYANYFLEFYAGLVWIAAAWSQTTNDQRPATSDQRPVFSILNSQFSIPGSWVVLLASLCMIGALLRYYPLWSETYLKPYGMIEQQKPPRVAFGQYGVWNDLQREDTILMIFGGINAALSDEVRTAGGPIFTDVPGVAAQAGQLARLQAFEHRQLHDANAWDQRPLLRDLANGRVPLVVLDYLGNWMTPEMIEIISRRYAQEGSRGTYDLYRPVAIGPPAAADLPFPNGPHLVGYHLAMSAGQPTYTDGETVLLTLDWKWELATGAGLNEEPAERSLAGSTRYDVVVQLLDDQGNVLLETVRPLLYGVLQPQDWSDGVSRGKDVIEHLQPVALPLGLPAGSYHLAITLRREGSDLAPPRTLTTIIVAEQGGRLLGEQGYFVPAPLLEAWRELGGYDGPGDPLMPAAPFAGYTLQCFERDCLRMSGQGIERLPLGNLIHLVDARLPPATAHSAAAPAETTTREFADTGQMLSGVFLAYWRENGGMARFGPPISGELLRGDRIVQYTRYARLERPVDGDTVRLGQLGEEYLRLPGGVAYRWP